MNMWANVHNGLTFSGSVRLQAQKMVSFSSFAFHYYSFCQKGRNMKQQFCIFGMCVLWIIDILQKEP